MRSVGVAFFCRRQPFHDAVVVGPGAVARGRREDAPTSKPSQRPRAIVVMLTMLRVMRPPVFRESWFLIFAIFTTEFLSPALTIGGKAVCNIILRHFLFSDVVCVLPFSLYVNVYCRSFLN